MTMRLGWPEHERNEYLRSVEPMEGITHPVEFQGIHRYMSIYRVPLDLPRYRLNNMRTMAMQEERQKIDGLEDDFFSADPESDNVQKIQHELLSELTSEAGLDERFEQAHVTQNEPLILTYDGVVANGNRRLTCWRNLYHNEPDKYSHYAHVDVVILPQCEERDIVRLEATLQLEKDIRGPYGWATQAIGLRRAVNPPFDMTHQEAASLYAVGKVSDVQRRIDELEYAEDYLQTRNIANMYSQIADKEFAFKRMVSLRSKTTAWPQAKKMKFEFLAFSMIDKPEGHGDLYRQILHLFNNIDLAIERVEEDLGDKISNDSESDVNDVGDSGDAYDFFTGGESAAPIDWRELSADELGEETADEVRDSIWDAIESGNALTKAGNKKKFVYNKLRDAHKAIQQAVVGASDSMSRDGVEAKVEEISDLIEQIRGWVENGEN